MLDYNSHRMILKYHPTIGHIWVPRQTARIPHERGGYILRTNGQGFRSDSEFQRERNGGPRILFFGDSMTAGDGCYNHERFAEQVGEILGVEVYNYGLSGSGTDQQLLVFEEFAGDVEADLIVIGIFVENIERIKAASRSIVQRITGKKLLVPKPYFTLTENGGLQTNNIPVPLNYTNSRAELDRVHSVNALRDANPKLKWIYRLKDAIRGSSRFKRIGRMLAPGNVEDRTWARSLLLRTVGFKPYADYWDMQSEGCRLMEAIVKRFISGAAPRPVLIVPIPTVYHYLDLLDPVYQKFYNKFGSTEPKTYVADITTALRNMSLEDRKKLSFKSDAHFSPFGHKKVAQLIVENIRTHNLLPLRNSKNNGHGFASVERKSSSETYVLGISCFYHDSAASLVKNGAIIAAAQEERFTRVKNDRSFPERAVNFCMEQAGIDVCDLKAVVYYDNVQLTFERLMNTLVEVNEHGRDLWLRMLPSWLLYKLHMPRLIRQYLKYDGLVLQNIHHRSHASSAFFPSPFKRAAILTIDGVGEWATASIGVGSGSKIELLKEMHFPHSLGLLYSAFTQFTGFKVNSGEYKMMGLAPYGRPVYVDAILEHLVDIKKDGSIELNMEYFSFLSKPVMTNEKFAELFGGPARKPDSRITRREMDLARSIQWVTEEAMLRMAKEAKRLTGEDQLCMAGGVALNCVANGRILREGPFKDIWIQPAAGDSGASLGAALDVYHTYFAKPRADTQNGCSLQGGSYFGPAFSDDEIEGFLQTYNYAYRKLDPSERAEAAAEFLKSGKVVGHFSGRVEFGPRALGSRSILGDPQNRDMQVKINKKIKYRESFRPFAPTVLAERISDYFELDKESPYMLLVAPVKEEHRIAFDRGEGEDLLEIVRKPRSNIPAVTHVDYSARIQSIKRCDHPQYHDVLKAFEKIADCGLVVNTSFNVRGEPIVNTPYDAYRCFMRTEMDVLLLGNFLLVKEQQPPWPEEKGHIEKDEAQSTSFPPELLNALTRIYENEFLPAVRRIKKGRYEMMVHPFKKNKSYWRDCKETTTTQSSFLFPEEMMNEYAEPARFASAITSGWLKKSLAAELTPLLSSLISCSKKFAEEKRLVEDVSESVYVVY